MGAQQVTNVNGAPVVTPIGVVLAAGKVEGDVVVAGTVSAIAVGRSRAGHDWAVATLDDGTGAIDVHIFPRAWRDTVCPVEPGVQLTVGGRLFAVPGGLTILALDVAPTTGEAR